MDSQRHHGRQIALKVSGKSEIKADRGRHARGSCTRRVNAVQEGRSRVGGSFFGFIPIRSTSNASLYALTRPSLESRAHAGAEKPAKTDRRGLDEGSRTGWQGKREKNGDRTRLEEEQRKGNSSAEARAFVFVFHSEEHAYFPRQH